MIKYIFILMFFFQSQEIPIHKKVDTLRKEIKVIQLQQMQANAILDSLFTVYKIDTVKNKFRKLKVSKK